MTEVQARSFVTRLAMKLSAVILIALAAACNKTEPVVPGESVVDHADGASEVILGPRSTKIIGEPTRVRAYQVMSPFDSKFKTAQKTMRLIDDYPILSEAPVPRDLSSKIAALLLNASSYDPSFALACIFQPRHALRFERGPEFVDVIMCFECNDLDIVPAPSLHEERTTQPFGKVAKPLYDAVSKIFAGKTGAL